METKASKLISEIMNKKAWRIVDFARYAEIHRGTVYNYLEGKKVRPGKAQHIEKALMKNARIFVPWEKLVE